MTVAGATQEQRGSNSVRNGIQLITVFAAVVLAALGFQLAPVRAQTPAAGTAAAAPTVIKAPTSPVTGNGIAGKKLYFDYACYACHGFNGETGTRPFVPNWPASLATERTFIAVLRGRASVAPVQPSTAMPNYAAETLSDAQATDIYAYIRSFSSNAPPIDKIPTLGQILTAARKPYKP